MQYQEALNSQEMFYDQVTWANQKYYLIALVIKYVNLDQVLLS